MAGLAHRERSAPIWHSFVNAHIFKTAVLPFLFLLLVACLHDQAKETQAKETIVLYEGIQQLKIQAKVNGAGIDRMTVELTRQAGANPLLVTIPPGTLFVSNSGGVQNTVSVGSATADLTAARTAIVSVAVACANMNLDVPHASNTFTVRPAHGQKELRAVVPVLHSAGADQDVIQAAVWILTDNADYEDLGTLVAGFTNQRQISETDAERAMMLIQRAGVELRGRRIWNGRRTICRAVLAEPAGAGPDVVSWCHSQLR